MARPSRRLPLALTLLSAASWAADPAPPRTWDLDALLGEARGELLRCLLRVGQLVDFVGREQQTDLQFEQRRDEHRCGGSAAEQARTGSIHVDVHGIHFLLGALSGSSAAHGNTPAEHAPATPSKPSAFAGLDANRGSSATPIAPKSEAKGSDLPSGLDQAEITGVIRRTVKSRATPVGNCGGYSLFHSPRSSSRREESLG